MKQTNYQDAVRQIKRIISKLYRRYLELEKCRELTSKEKEKILSIDMDMDDVTAQTALQDLCDYLNRYYGKKQLFY